MRGLACAGTRRSSREEKKPGEAIQMSIAPARGVLGEVREDLPGDTRLEFTKH